MATKTKRQSVRLAPKIRNTGNFDYGIYISTILCVRLLLRGKCCVDGDGEKHNESGNAINIVVFQCGQYLVATRG